MVKSKQLFCFIGIGMGSFNDLSQNIVSLLTTMDQIYIENYTNFPKQQFLNFESISDIPIKIV